MPLPERPVLRAPRRRLPRLPRIKRRPGRARAWLVLRGTELRVTGMCVTGTAAAYVAAGLAAGLAAACVSFGFMEWMSGDDDGQP
jgi:hypothetical protein